MEFTELVESTGIAGEDWQDILHERAGNGTALLEIGVGVYSVSYEDCSHERKPVFFDWYAATAEYQYRAGLE